MIKLTPRKLLFTTVLPVLVVTLFVGCSIKPVPYDEFLYFEDEYYDEFYGAGFRQDHVKYDDYSYRAWQMSQYYKHANEAGYQAYVEANAGNNTNRSPGSYRSGETPVRQAPKSDQSQRITQSNRVKQRQDTGNQRLTQRTARDFQTEIGEKQKTEAEKRRREEMKESRDKRKRAKKEDEKLTEEELKKRRKEARKKKRKR